MTGDYYFKKKKEKEYYKVVTRLLNTALGFYKVLQSKKFFKLIGCLLFVTCWRQLVRFEPME